MKIPAFVQICFPLFGYVIAFAVTQLLIGTANDYQRPAKIAGWIGAVVGAILIWFVP